LKVEITFMLAKFSVLVGYDLTCFITEFHEHAAIWLQMSQLPPERATVLLPDALFIWIRFQYPLPVKDDYGAFFHSLALLREVPGFWVAAAIFSMTDSRSVSISHSQMRMTIQPFVVRTLLLAWSLCRFVAIFFFQKVEFEAGSE
jgi:hypothetical protein